MRFVLLLALFEFGLSALAGAQRYGYHVIGDSSGGWARALEAIGLRPSSAKSAAVYVVRPGSDDQSLDWTSAVRDGAFLIIEGVTPLAARLGFIGVGESVLVRRELDARYTGQFILWQEPLRVAQVTTRAGTRVFSRDRWSSAPLLAGRKSGAGAILWAAVSPGKSGFERLPYLPQALFDLGLVPPTMDKRLQVFFDYSYRTRADPEYLAARWRASGISRLFVSSWYFLEPDTERDRYLTRLVEAAHRNGITVYAWLELPHVDERFWQQHPEWREKNGVLEDALVDWRKNMNLLNDQSFAAAEILVTALLRRFDWDGAVLSELYFEGTRGLRVPADMTPFNDDVRREVKVRYGFDPASLFNDEAPGDPERRPARLQQFLAYRAELQRRLHERWLDVLVRIRGERGSFGITVCYVDDLSEPTMRDLIGADVRSLLPMLESRDVSLLVQDAYVLWGQGPDRYKRIGAEYAPLVPRERLGVDINIVTRKVATFPTRHQTGTELLQLVHTGQREFGTVALYAEHSLLPPDLGLLTSAQSTVDVFEPQPDATVIVESRLGVGVRWRGEARVDGAAWPYVSDGVVWLPGGRHTVSVSHVTPMTRVVDFTGDLGSLAATPEGIRLRYRADARAIVSLDRMPIEVLVDDVRTTVPMLNGAGGRTTLMLPAGGHRVELRTITRVPETRGDESVAERDALQGAKRRVAVMRRQPYRDGTQPTCALAAVSCPSACCHRKNTTEMITKKNSPPGTHMINAPIN